jgi:hypothetical protein
VNKIDAARKQIELSIRLLFQNEDPIGIHALSAAGFRIFRDLISIKPDNQINQYFKTIIKPGMEGKFWKLFNRTANFLKHAEKDPHATLENVPEEINDGLIILACFYYKELGYEWTPEMVAFIMWYMVLHPEFAELMTNDQIIHDVIAEEQNTIRAISRSEQLNFGKFLFDIAMKKIS